jgi:hypothetical protein
MIRNGSKETRSTRIGSKESMRSGSKESQSSAEEHFGRQYSGSRSFSMGSFERRGYANAPCSLGAIGDVKARSYKTPIRMEYEPLSPDGEPLSPLSSFVKRNLNMQPPVAVVHSISLAEAAEHLTEGSVLPDDAQVPEKGVRRHSNPEILLPSPGALRTRQGSKDTPSIQRPTSAGASRQGSKDSTSRCRDLSRQEIKEKRQHAVEYFHEAREINQKLRDPEDIEAILKEEKRLRALKRERAMTVPAKIKALQVRPQLCDALEKLGLEKRGHGTPRSKSHSTTAVGPSEAQAQAQGGSEEEEQPTVTKTKSLLEKFGYGVKPKAQIDFDFGTMPHSDDQPSLQRDTSSSAGFREVKAGSGDLLERLRKAVKKVSADEKEKKRIVSLSESDARAS